MKYLTLFVLFLITLLCLGGENAFAHPNHAFGEEHGLINFFTRDHLYLIIVIGFSLGLAYRLGNK